MKLSFAIILAGAVGTLCRYGIMQIPWGAKFPYGTLAVNLLGAFLAGLCYILLKSRCPDYAQYSPVLFIGFFGAFTTFSTFMLDTAKYLEAGHCGLAFLNLVLQNGLGLACAFLGILLAKKLFV